MKKTISELLRESMETNNMNLEELRTKIGISRATLYRVLHNPHNMNNSIIEKIANYLGCDIEELGGVRKPIKKECDILPSAMQVDKIDAIKAAKDFNYGKDVYEALETAKTLGEINRIMATARHKKFG